MALYITHKHGYILEWHIGQPIPINYRDIKTGSTIPFRTDTISEIQADGDELEKIQELFSSKPDYKDGVLTYTIPMPDIRVVNWFGDIANLH